LPENGLGVPFDDVKDNWVVGSVYYYTRKREEAGLLENIQWFGFFYASLRRKS